MKISKHRVTFKILAGYITIGMLATVFGFLILSEIKTFTKVQGQDITDQNKILKVGSLIADIYKNESLARAAIQLNSSKKFKEYNQENKRLLLTIDSLKYFTKKTSQEFIFDSIKVIINKKLKNITSLKNLKRSYNSDDPISTVINKLNAIDSLLVKDSVDDIIKSPAFINLQARLKFEKYNNIINGYQKDTVILDEKKIDSLISISKNMLEKAQKEAIKQRISLLRKESQLIENDLIISRKLQELLSTLENDVIAYNNTINKQREKTLSRSKNIMLLAAGISLLIIIFFSITFLNDFWKSQRYRKQLEKANEKTSSLLKNREQIISMVSHDLRTPLSTITGYSELLQNSTYATKESNYIEHISNASNYMGQLVNDLMQFSKLESGETSLECIPFDLKKLINEVALSAKTLIKNKPIEFAVKHDSNLNYSIISDPFRIKQILTNLVTNACKFTNQGFITIESFLKINGNDKILEISVNDTGIGISKEQQKTIFKAFTQASTTKKSNRNGFGLGLTISKKLTELLKGTLTLKSEPSKGSTFTLKIPVNISNEPIKSSETPKPEINFNLSAIVVEDDASIRQLLNDFLKQYAIKSYIFSDAQSALDAIDNTPYDFVLTDIQLPKMNGIHFMETLKKQESYNNQPIIAMTGRLNLSKADYDNSGFAEVLIKPFRAIDLQNILHQFFGSSFMKTKTTYKINDGDYDDESTNEFNITSLKTFLNNDSEAINKTLAIFLKDTKKNILLLKQAQKNNNLEAFNLISHTMLSMFKQLEAKKIIPFLETFESAKSIDHKDFIDFENVLENFITSLETYLN